MALDFDEMHSNLNPSAIQFGLLRFSLGKGTFARTKLVGLWKQILH